jgi:tRNA(fMet)-specific endonuclease VapC
MSYLIDSDYLIDGLNGLPGSMETLGTLNPSGMSISIVTLGELYEGAVRYPDRSERLDAIRDFLGGFDVLALTDEIIEIFAVLRADLRQRGQLISDFDLLIAATAIRFEMTLVTRNLRHFERIDGLKIYSGNDD